jgi:hypothetical protein
MPQKVSFFFLFSSFNFFFSFSLFFFFEIGAYYVAQAGLKLLILLPQPPKCWDYRCNPRDFCSVAQAGLELCGSNDIPALVSSVPGTTGSCHCTWLIIIE